MKNYFLLIGISLIMHSCANGQLYQNVNSETFRAKINNVEGILLDVRTQQEYTRAHIEGSTLISTSDPKFVDKVMLLQKNKPIYIYCLTGSRSRAVANYLSQNGYTKVYNLQRGIVEWNQLGYPLTQSNEVVASSSKVYNSAEFQQLLSNNLVLVDFHAPWCAPCKKMAPDIDKLKRNFKGKAKVEKIDIEVNKNIQQQYQVTSIPGLVLFKNGKEIWRHTGVLSYNELSAVMNKHL